VRSSGPEDGRREVHQQRLAPGVPDPITRLSWDNAILVSPRLAKELG